MAGPSVTYPSFTTGTTVASAQMNQNFLDAKNWGTSGSVDWTVAALSSTTLTVSGAAAFNGTVALGNATGDDITVTGYVASAVVPKTNQTYALGDADKGWDGIYLGVASAGSITTRLKASASTGSDYTFTFPTSGGTNNYVLMTDGSANTSWTLIADANVSGSAAISGSKLQAAAAGNAGAVTTGSQTFAGAKTFSSNLSVSGASGTMNAAVSDSGTDSAPYVSITNDARTWQLKVDGGSSDMFVIRDQTGTADRVKIDSSGNLGINRGTPGKKLTVGDTGTAPALFIREDTGTALSFLILSGNNGSTDCGSLQGNTSANTVSLVNASDRRMKQNFRPMADVLQRLLQVKLHEYELKNTGGTSYGVIAQELIDLFPELVIKTDDGIGEIDKEVGPWQVLQSWHYILIKALQESSQEIADLKKQVSELK